jgi:hypothetical protein
MAEGKEERGSSQVQDEQLSAPARQSAEEKRASIPDDSDEDISCLYVRH